MTAAKPRPGLIYGTVFVWLSVVGGRFTAPFLEHEARLSDAEVGAALSLTAAVGSLLGPRGGRWADDREKRLPKRGRAEVLFIGVSLGSAAFLMHGARRMFPSFSFLGSAGWHFSLRIAYAFASALTFPVMDGLALAHLEAEPGKDRSDFGRERLHGAVWWGVSNVLLGPCLDRWGFPVMYCFAMLSTAICFVALSFYVQGQDGADEDQSGDGISELSDSAVVGNPTQLGIEKRNSDAICPDDDVPLPLPELEENCVVSSNLKMERTDDEGTAVQINGKEAVAPISTSTLLRIMLGTVYGSTFLLYYCFLNVGTSVVEGLVFLYFEYLKSSFTMCGVTVLLTVVFEIPIFQTAPMLLQRYGAGNMQIVAGVAYAVRVLGYSLVPKGHMVYVLILEPLHGITYACSKLSAVEFVATLVPSGYEAGGQGLLGLFSGLGSVSGLLFAGILEDTIGPRFLYRCLAFLVFVGMTVFGLAKCRQPTTTRPEVVPQGEVEITDHKI